MKAQIKLPDSGYPLITRERTEKLELLNHLVSNLAHAIVVCGPEGIGKTKVLKTFQDTTEEPWIFCCLTISSGRVLPCKRKVVAHFSPVTVE